MVGADRIALANLTTRWIAGLFKRQRVTEKSIFAHFAMGTISVVYASETLSGRAVAVANGIFIHVAVAFTLLTRPNFSRFAHGVSKVAILAFLTTETHSTRWTLCAFWTLDIAENFHTRSTVRARARLTIFGSAS